MLALAPLVALLPFLAFLAILTSGRHQPRSSSWIATLATGAAFVLSCGILIEVLGGGRFDFNVPWIELGALTRSGTTAAASSRTWLAFGFQVDPLTAVMLVVVTSVSLLVHLYSMGYLTENDEHGDPHLDSGFARYYIILALFTTSMLGLVLANNLLTTYIFWELVGLCSFLLIGHWHEQKSVAEAAKKAFLVTRFGDFGLLLGILFLFWHSGTLHFVELTKRVAEGHVAGPALTIGILLVFCGAVGKSAQFPLHDWLPDAMAGPTPVSALIHAATMVAAGVYLMARTFPILEHSPVALTVVAIVGAFTALFAATMGLVATDIKRVLAYSTVSQLGYMMLAIGTGAMAAGMFHLFNHAFFKALLFLCAGSVIHLLGTNNLLEMGGLTRWRPITAAAMTIAALSLAGIPPFSGFWSKDEILLAALNTHPLLFAVGLLTAFMTAFYMFRVIFLTFLGTYRGTRHYHPESWTMKLPLLILIVPTMLSGLWGLPFTGNPFASFLEGHAAHAEFRIDVAGLSVLVALAGIGAAWALYGGGRIDAEAKLQRFGPLYACLANGYYVDNLYRWIAGRLVLGVAWVANQFDTVVVDGVVNGVGATTLGLGSLLRRAQTGQVQTYAWAMFAGAVVLALAFALRTLR